MTPPGGWVFLARKSARPAVLTELIFVAVSINLKRILEYPALPLRALEALYMLTLVLITSTVVLIPSQPELLIALELLVVGLLACVGLISSRGSRSTAAWQHRCGRGDRPADPASQKKN